MPTKPIPAIRKEPTNWKSRPMPSGNKYTTTPRPYLFLYLPSCRAHVSLSWALSQAFASWAIPLPAGIRLTPAPSKAGEPTGSFTVPDLCLALNLGSHYSPGYFRDAIWINGGSVQSSQPAPVLFFLSFWTKPITHVVLLTLTTIQT